jgi:dTDP-4-amino-4,6-dideoxygalactose transaminase
MNNPYDVVRQFEDRLCEYTGFKYCVTVESCTAAIFLSLMYLVRNNKYRFKTVTIPSFTYPSVANSIIHAGLKVEFENIGWQEKGWYHLKDTGIIDSAKYMGHCMPQYIDVMFPIVCLSFHAKKIISIGRGGAILTNDKYAYDWLKLARFDGRHECALNKDILSFPGWNMYMTPEQAARGLELMQWLPNRTILPPDSYQDLSQYDFYKK